MAEEQEKLSLKKKKAQHAVIGATGGAIGGAGVAAGGLLLLSNPVTAPILLVGGLLGAACGLFWGKDAKTKKGALGKGIAAGAVSGVIVAGAIAISANDKNNTKNVEDGDQKKKQKKKKKKKVEDEDQKKKQKKKKKKKVEDEDQKKKKKKKKKVEDEDEEQKTKSKSPSNIDIVKADPKSMDSVEADCSGEAHDQGKTSICYAYAVATAVRATEERNGQKLTPHSDLVKSIVKNAKMNKEEGKTWRVLQYESRLRQLKCQELKSAQQAKETIAKNRVVVAGFSLSPVHWKEFRTFFKKNPNGILDNSVFTNIKGQKQTGRTGHAVVITEYSKSKNCWKVKNSWGSKFAKDGYFHVKVDALPNARYRAITS